MKTTTRALLPTFVLSAAAILLPAGVPAQTVASTDAISTAPDLADTVAAMAVVQRPGTERQPLHEEQARESLQQLTADLNRLALELAEGKSREETRALYWAIRSRLRTLLFATRTTSVAISGDLELARTLWKRIVAYYEPQ